MRSNNPERSLSVKRLWRARLSRILIVLSSVGLFAILSAGWWLPALGRWLERPPTRTQADAIVILGGGFPHRDQHGLDLYRQGFGGEIWRTGANPAPGGQDARRAQQLALAAGVPPQHFFLLDSDSTWSDGEQIAALAHARQVRSVLIVTEWTHSRRALCVISHHLADSGVSIAYDPPRDFWFQPDDWWRLPVGRNLVIGELVKSGFYWLRYGVAPFGCT